MKINLIIFLSVLILLLNGIPASEIQLSDQGSNIKSKSNGQLLSSGSLTVTIYDASSGGNVVYNETFSNAISNGSWSVMLGENSSNLLNLKFGKAYYKDYTIAGESVNFTNSTGGTTDRQIFYSPLGDIGGEHINYSSNFTIGGLNVTGNLTTNLLSASCDVKSYINGTLYCGTDENGTSWAQAVNGTLANTGTANVFGNFNQTFNGTTWFLWSLLNRIGVGTTTPQNTLNVIGDLNATTSIFSQGNNLSLAYFYATNNTWDVNYSNFSNVYRYSINDSLWTLNYSDYLATRNYALNDSLWTSNYSTFLTKIDWVTVTNGTMALWSQSVNGTLARTDAANTFGAFNQTFDTNTFFINSNENKVGINTTLPNSTLHVIGDINATTVYSGNNNLTVGYLYAVNSTGNLTSENDPHWGTNLTAYNDTWKNITNLTYHTGYLYATNGTYLTKTGDNGTGTYNFNSGWQSGGLTIQNGDLYAQAIYVYNITSLAVNNLAVNGSLLPQQGWNNTFDVGNGTYVWRNLHLGGDANIAGNVLSAGRNLTIGYDYALNDSRWTSNYSDFLTTKNYALNDSLWTLNYSNFSTITYPYAVNSTGTLTWPDVTNGTLATWVQVTNGTLANTGTANTFGNFNQTFNGTTLHIWVLLNRIGIGTTTPQNTLNVIGNINGTTGVFSQDKNLSVGYDYALNATGGGISWATANNGTLLNYSSALNGTLATWANVVNGTMTTWSNSVNGTLASWANIENGTFASWADAVNGTLALNSSLATYSAPIGEPLWSATANYSNFSTIVYGYAVNSTGGGVNYSNILGNQTFNSTFGYFNVTNQTSSIFIVNDTGAFVNGSIINFNLSNIIYPYAINSTGTLTWPDVTNGTLATWANVVNGTVLTAETLWNANYSNFSTLYANSFSYYNSTNLPVNYTNILANQTFNFTNGYFNLTNQTGLVVLFNNSGVFVNGSIINLNLSNIIYPYAINGSTWALTGNYSNFSTVVYGYAVNATTWAQVTNGTMASWANIENGTFASWEDVVNGTVGGGSTNYSNILSNQTFNSTNGYFNITNQTSSTFIVNNTGAFVNGSIINFNLSNIIYPYTINNTWQGNFSNFSTIVYPYAINGSTFALNYSNFSNIYAYENNGTFLNRTGSTGNGNYTFNITTANGFFNLTNSSNAPIFYVNASTGFIGIGTATPQNALNIIGVLNVTNGTNSIGSLYVGANGKVGIGNSTPANTLIVSGDTNTTGGVYLTNTKCSAGQVLKSDTTTGLISCVTDQTSGGGRTLNSTSADMSITSTTFGTSILALDVSANTNYTFGCDWIANSSVATTGVQFNVSVPASPTYFAVVYRHYTTAIASYTNGCTGTWTNCTNLSAGNPVTFYPIELTGRLINGANAGIINFSVKSETGSPVMIKRGSYCHIATEA